MPLFALTTPASSGVVGSSEVSFFACDAGESDRAGLLGLNISSAAAGLETGAGEVDQKNAQWCM